MDCKEVEDLLPAYALNVLSSQEAALVEAHLDTCHWCTSLLREHMQVAAALAKVADPLQPSQELRDRTMKAARAQVRRLKAPRVPLFTRGNLVLAGTASVAGTFLAAVIVVGLVMSNRIDDLQTENSKLTSQVSQLINDLERDNSDMTVKVSRLAEEDQTLLEMFQEQRSMNYVMAAPDRQVLSLQGGEGVPRAEGMLLITSQGSTGILIAKGLEPSWGDDAYHVWLKRDGQRLTVGRLVVDETGWGALTLWPEEPISFFQQVWVTEGPVHDGAEPIPSPVLWGTISPR